MNFLNKIFEKTGSARQAKQKFKYFSLNSNAYGIPHAIGEIYGYFLSIIIESTQIRFLLVRLIVK